MPTRSETRAIAAGILSLVLLGCGEPGEREVGNARAFEALLTAVSLRDPQALEAVATVIEQRRDSGDLSDASHREIAPIIARGRAGDWPGSVGLAYEFRGKFGDRGAYFR